MGRKLTQKEFVGRSQEVHGNKYDYSKSVYVGRDNKIEIVCPVHGNFWQSPHNHFHGEGCKKCGELIRVLQRTSSTNDFIKKAKTIYGNRYDYSKFVYVRSFVKGIIVCPTHGDFSQSPNNHLRGAECPSCFGTPKKTTDEFVKDAIKMWGKKYDYSEVDYHGNKKKVRITCRKHGKFFQKPNGHLSGAGCPRCQSSRGELKVEQCLRTHKIPYIRQKTFVACVNPKTNQRFKFDFYAPSKNLLIEYDGEQHFRGGYVGCHKMTKPEFGELNARDRCKTAYAKSRGITLLRIKYTSLRRIDAILAARLS
jgi:very-short-patch-repair endonuclease